MIIGLRHQWGCTNRRCRRKGDSMAAGWVYDEFRSSQSDNVRSKHSHSVQNHQHSGTALSCFLDMAPQATCLHASHVYGSQHTIPWIPATPVITDTVSHRHLNSSANSGHTSFGGGHTSSGGKGSPLVDDFSSSD